MDRLGGKKAIITGCSSGIGKAMAIRFAQEGAKLAICARRLDALEETAKLCREAGVEVLAMRCDVSKYGDMEAFIKAAAERFSTIDILVNNATSGIWPRLFVDTTVEEFNEVFNSGFWSTWHMMRLCFPYMKEHGGHVLNFGSRGGTEAQILLSSYDITKSAVHCLSMVAAREWGEHNITVNVTCPMAWTDTIDKEIQAVPEDQREPVLESVGFLKGPIHRYGKVDDIVPVAVFLCSDEAGFITGQIVFVEGGVTTHT